MPGRKKKASAKTLTDRTIDFWRDFAGVELTPHEADEAVANVAAYFRLLHKWSIDMEGGEK
jgi:hypothetical protein